MQIQTVGVMDDYDDPIIDFNDQWERKEFIGDMHALITDYVYRKIKPYVDVNAPPSEHYREFCKVHDQIKAHFIMKWVDYD